MARRRVIGVDFDNTLVTYDDVLHRVAVERGLIPTELEKSKRIIRDHIRESREGDAGWHALQTVVYGERMNEARLMAGVREFFARCRLEDVPVYVISHKTERAGGGGREVNLRHAATAWMERHRFFDPEGLGLSPDGVHFESTRAEKIARIRAVGCTHFIDDLEETLLDPTFPADVQRILYTASPAIPSHAGVTVLSSWKEISEYFFGA